MWVTVMFTDILKAFGKQKVNEVMFFDMLKYLYSISIFNNYTLR